MKCPRSSNPCLELRYLMLSVSYPQLVGSGHSNDAQVETWQHYFPQPTCTTGHSSTTQGLPRPPLNHDESRTPNLVVLHVLPKPLFPCGFFKGIKMVESLVEPLFPWCILFIRRRRWQVSQMTPDCLAMGRSKEQQCTVLEHPGKTPHGHGETDPH